MDNTYKAASTSIILIPAYRPDAKLIELLRQLLPCNFRAVIVVNDGSGEEYGEIFRTIESMSEVTILNHAVNMGKGAALKTGFNFICGKYQDAACVITADADGQHTPEDILRMSRQFANDPASLLLGVRSFDKNVPFRSLFGNKLTAVLMRLILNIKVSDTQTGLRAIPISFLPELMHITYNRYEFELEMLLCAKRNRIQITEMPISTVYINDNASSHFNPLRDSFKIYIVLFRYAIVSILASLVDYMVFLPVLLVSEYTGLMSDSSREIIAVAAGRFAGALLQYCMIRKIVFRTAKSILSTLPQYILLVAVSGVASYIIMNYLEEPTGLSDALTKIIAEAALFLANFMILREFVFHPPK